MREAFVETHILEFLISLFLKVFCVTPCCGKFYVKRWSNTQPQHKSCNLFSVAILLTDVHKMWHNS